MLKFLSNFFQKVCGVRGEAPKIDFRGKTARKSILKKFSWRGAKHYVCGFDVFLHLHISHDNVYNIS